MICDPCRNQRHDICVNHGKDYPSCDCQHRIKETKKNGS